jgi:CheY-like chemotaxis protein
MAAETPAPCILVVEDDELTREFVMDLIVSFGYQAVAAANGLDAIRMIEEIPTITLVFTDITMPGVDGIMLADMVKQHRPKLKILYTTGGHGVSRLKSEAGILHGNILAKPYRPDDLRREIERILD